MGVREALSDSRESGSFANPWDLRIRITDAMSFGAIRNLESRIILESDPVRNSEIEPDR